MTTMNIEVEMPQMEQLALISTINRVLKDDRGIISPAGRSAFHKVRQAAIYAVEVKNAGSMEAAS
ncbi:MAG: hypothetical protein GY942_13220 [Aestuariibacter sp.]|nr:hypothetical protein [Aestuariibacter sp.]